MTELILVARYEHRVGSVAQVVSHDHKQSKEREVGSSSMLGDPSADAKPL